MQNNGWVKLHRAQFDNWVSEKRPWCDGYAWCYLYSRANHKKGMVNFRNEYIEVQRGQFITSIRKLGDIFGWCRGRVQNYLFILEKDAQIVQQTSHRYTVITICNYERYQSRAIRKSDSKKDTDIHPEVASDEPQGSTNKKSTKSTKKESFVPDPKHLELANLLKAKILENNPKALIKDTQIKQWAKSVRLMVERDHRTLDEIETVIVWSQQDEFWCTNILSMSKLREQFDQLWVKMSGEKPKNSIPPGRDPLLLKMNGWEKEKAERKRIEDEIDRKAEKKERAAKGRANDGSGFTKI